MDTLISFLYIMAGMLLRLAVPIAGTTLLIFFLRRLDARWQAEAELQPVAVGKPDCWKIKGCAPEQIKNCPTSTSNLPCWQVHRQPNGYLNEACISCEVFIEAPVPTLKVEPRRI
ncbi:MAG: hypothetical protein ABI621_10630 [Chloroflexota bacterium]